MCVGKTKLEQETIEGIVHDLQVNSNKDDVQTTFSLSTKFNRMESSINSNVSSVLGQPSSLCSDSLLSASISMDGGEVRISLIKPLRRNIKFDNGFFCSDSVQVQYLLTVFVQLFCN